MFEIKPATWAKGHPSTAVPTPPTDRPYRDLASNIFYVYKDGAWGVFPEWKPIGK